MLLLLYCYSTHPGDLFFNLFATIGTVGKLIDITSYERPYFTTVGLPLEIELVPIPDALILGQTNAVWKPEPVST